MLNETFSVIFKHRAKMAIEWAKQTFKFEYNLRTLKLLDIPSMNVDLNVRLVLAPYKGFLPVPLFG